MVIRLDVTPYSDAHCGHAWVAYHAHAWARRSGREFLLRFDDEGYTRGEVWRQSWPMQKAATRFREDLDWLGLTPDRVAYTSAAREEAVEAGRALGVRPQEAMGEAWQHNCAYPLGSPNWHPWGPLMQVVSDHANRVSGLVRGMDLLPQSQLYVYLWTQLYGGLPPEQRYLRLVWRDSHGAKESKTNGDGVSLRELREAGYEPAQIIDTLRECDRRAQVHMQPAQWLLNARIPAGVLGVDEVNWLPYREEGLEGQVVYEHEHENPWADDVTDACEPFELKIKWLCPECGADAERHWEFCPACHAGIRAKPERT